MRFSVRVPVLSEQITVVPTPSVSTAGSLRTSARRAAMRLAPSARATVTTAGSPSGMAATARLTAVRNIRSTGWPLATPTANTTPQTTSAATAMRRPRTASRRCSGVCSAGWRCSSSARRPSSVAIPVATTTPAPRPPVTAVPWNAMLRRSASIDSSISGRGSTCLLTGLDSPVRAASLTRSAHDSVRRRSAATRSPGPSSTRSPGTSSAAGRSCIPPPRRRAQPERSSP